ncbi:hypothetical protein B0T13DRAFT_523951 [Neurospora crassa]|nr:hypothetical protein B0T13DRAFT_523951 [Neurospora crassa]
MTTDFWCNVCAGEMEPPNPPPERVATSLENFYQIQREKQAEKEAAATPQPNTTADDFPDDPVTQCALVNQMVEAMQNMDDIVDNFVDNPNENDAVRFVLSVPRKDLLEESWKLLGKAYDAQRGILDPDVFSPEIPNFITRWRLMMGTFRHCKAAVSDLFSVPFVQRYTANPVMELDTKVSNNHTNKMRKYNKEVQGSNKYGGGATTVGDVTEARNGLGEVVERFIKPRKRPLAELLGEDLARFAEVKRLRTRTTTGGSAASGGASGITAAVGIMPTLQGQPAKMQEQPASQEQHTAIQETPAAMLDEAASIQVEPIIDNQLAQQQNQEGSEPLVVSNGLSSPEPSFSDYSPLDQYQAPDHHQSLDGEFGYNSLNQYLPAPELGADAGSLMWDQEHQQPDNSLDFFDLDEYIRRSQPIAGSSGDKNGSQAAEGSESADQSKN